MHDGVCLLIRMEKTEHLFVFPVALLNIWAVMVC